MGIGTPKMQKSRIDLLEWLKVAWRRVGNTRETLHSVV